CLPVSSVVRLPFASYVGVVAPLTAVISFCLLAVRVWAAPFVVWLSKFPTASKSQDWLRVADPVSPVLVPLRVPRWKLVGWLSPSYAYNSLWAGFNRLSAYRRFESRSYPYWRSSTNPVAWPTHAWSTTRPNRSSPTYWSPASPAGNL